MASVAREVIHTLIQKAYIAGSDASRWPEFLEEFRLAVDGGNSVLGFVDRSAGGAGVTAYAGYSAEAIRKFREFAHLDPFANGAAALEPLEPGFIGLAQDLISDEELERTEYYQRFGRDHGAIGGLICVLYAEDSLTAVLGASRRPGRHFGAQEVELARVLVPHLRTALQIHRQLSQEARIGRAAISTLNRMQSAVFVCDADANILYSNASAKALGNEWTFDGRLFARSSAELKALRKAVASAATPTGEGDHLIKLTSGDGSPCTALVTPVHHDTTLALIRTTVAVLLHAPRDGSAHNLHHVARLFNLTPSEARLADRLLCGDSLREASVRLSLSYETVRSYLKRLMEKTGTKRQPELVRVLLVSLPPF